MDWDSSQKPLAAIPDAKQSTYSEQTGFEPACISSRVWKIQAIVTFQVDTFSVPVMTICLELSDTTLLTHGKI